MQIQGNELLLQDNSLITTKTDLKGIITYANHDFIQFSGYDEEELIGANHNIVRHPAMPRIIFKVLWDTIKSGKEINAFVINKNKQNYDYWVYANVTPSFDNNGNIIGYYSVRRKPNRKAIPFISDVYALLLKAEKDAKARGDSEMKASASLLEKTLNGLNMDHRIFFITLQKNGGL